jgi:HAD superfamily hydrolase (TIGR01509 family)
MIKIIFFDFDGVLTTDESGARTVSKNLCEMVPELNLDQVMESYRKVFGELKNGKGTYAEHLNEFSAAIGTAVNMDMMTKALRKVPRNDSLFRPIMRMRRVNKVGIITDNPAERMKLLREDMHLDDFFNPIIVSGEIGVSKKDGGTAIFDAALKAAGVQPNEAFFIDNKKENLQVPRKMGMRTYHHDDELNDVASLLLALEKYAVELR